MVNVDACLASQRRRGLRPIFDGARLAELARFLQGPESTIAGAADHFGCSTSTIEKTLAKARKEARARRPKLVPLGVKRVLGEVGRLIEARGWDGDRRSIGGYVQEATMNGAATMEWLLGFTRCSVMVWEGMPGRTQADVLALLARAMGAGRVDA